MYYVYIMASRRGGALYIGVTGNLLRRVWEHRTHQHKGFTARYNIGRLVWYEATESIHSAIAREKQMKRWRRSWKVELIEAMNPQWRDLFDDISPRESYRPEP